MQMNSYRNFGIINMQLYFPRYYVDQSELEEYDKVGKGKYTIGLGQSKLAFVGDREDINSICLTVLDKLIKKANLCPQDIGRLEIGTETFLDKSKSIKTYLMDFFKDTNCDIEGVTTSNACYGGTNALFNAINWMQSESYDGRYSIVICADIAVYAKGNARPTGGCGAVAILLGPNAPIVFENVRSTYMNNVYDFYKPNPVSEYPTVDGVFSIDCYFRALESCYETYLDKQRRINRECVNLNSFDFFAFHSPFSKMVEKAFVQLVSYDLRMNKEQLEGKNNYYQQASELKEIFSKNKIERKLDSKLIEKIRSTFKDVIKTRLEPSLFLGKNLGNIYTGSLYIGLLSLIMDNHIDLLGKRIFLFSYGSGCAASIFTLKVTGSYELIKKSNLETFEDLNKRIKVSPQGYEKIMLRKEKLFLSNNYTPSDSVEELYDGTYYLEQVDDKWRRFYTRKGDSVRKIQFNKLSNKDKVNDALGRINLIKSHLNQSKDNTIGMPNKIKIEDSIWSGFHRKTIYERLLQIEKVYPDLQLEKLKTGGLNLMRADNMIENCIGLMSIPIGLGLNFTINNKKYSVPMAVEEPSVIAAVSAAAKLIGENNGFFCYSDPPLMTTQIHYVNVDPVVIDNYIKTNKEKLMSYANNYCQNMVQRGGGVQEIYCRTLKPATLGELNGATVVEVVVNVCDSMGANLLNTIAENLAEHLDHEIKARAVMKILTNLSIFRKATAEFKINLNNLKYKNIEGEELAKRILNAQMIAELDSFRAATHNKGIMNGIDAVALALGQDWRAIEASAHAYASLDQKTLKPNSYQPLTYYKVIEVKGEKYLYGNLTMPLAVGVVGGAINSNENYSNMMSMLGNPNAQQLANIMVAVGLAQNFAALRALVSEGIQKGHMGLQARNVALRAGVPDYLIPDVVNFMKNNKSITEQTAKKYMESVHLYNELRSKNKAGNIIDTKDLSSFYVEVDYSFLRQPITMNFLLKTKIEPPIHFCIISRKMKNDDHRNDEIFKILFGQQKMVDWLHEFMKFINDFEVTNLISSFPEYNAMKYKMKMMLVLLYVISYNLLSYNFEQTRTFLNNLLKVESKEDDILNNFQTESMPLNFGFGVIVEIYRIIKFFLSNYLKKNQYIGDRILKEINYSLMSFISTNEICKNIKHRSIDEETFNAFLDYRLKRLNATVMILCDIAFSDENISEQTVDYLLALGKYVEIRVTLLRDYVRSNESGSNQINSYILFEELCHTKEINDPIEIKERYFKLRTNESEQLRQKFSSLCKVNDGFLTFLDNIDKNLDVYYKTNTERIIKPHF